MAEDIVMPSNTGVRIGQGSFKYLLLQIHWNNPDKRDDLTGTVINALKFFFVYKTISKRQLASQLSGLLHRATEICVPGLIWTRQFRLLMKSLRLIGTGKEIV